VAPIEDHVTRGWGSHTILLMLAMATTTRPSLSIPKQIAIFLFFAVLSSHVELQRDRRKLSEFRYLPIGSSLSNGYLVHLTIREVTGADKNVWGVLEDR